jgi:hypothetical protein
MAGLRKALGALLCRCLGLASGPFCWISSAVLDCLGRAPSHRYQMIETLAVTEGARKSDYTFSSNTLTILRTYGRCFRGFRSARLLSYEPGSMILIVTLRTPQ